MKLEGKFKQGSANLFLRSAPFRCDGRKNHGPTGHVLVTARDMAILAMTDYGRGRPCHGGQDARAPIPRSCGFSVRLDRLLY
jgi:hypothetical protein